MNRACVISGFSSVRLFQPLMITGTMMNSAYRPSASAAMALSAGSPRRWRTRVIMAFPLERVGGGRAGAAPRSARRRSPGSLGGGIPGGVQLGHLPGDVVGVVQRLAGRVVGVVQAGREGV